MKWVLWLGIMPLIFGVKYFWQWVVKDRANWAYLDDTYKSTFPIRLIVALGLIGLGIFLLIFVGSYLGEKY